MGEIYKIELLPVAVDDLDGINEYFINAPDAGDKVFERIYRGISQLTTFPNSGHLYDDNEFADSGFRRLVIDKRYQIFYKVLVDVVEIHRIIPSKKLGMLLNLN